MFPLLSLSTFATETTTLANVNNWQVAGIAGALGLAIGFVIAIMLIFGLALYVYTSWAWYTIAKKLKYKKAWLAWIPVANFFLYPILAKKIGFGVLLF